MSADTAPIARPADFIPNQIVVEFDAQSEFTLPFEVHVELSTAVVVGDDAIKTGWRG